MRKYLIVFACLLSSCFNNNKSLYQHSASALLIDTTKLKSDFTDVLTSVASGKPDTTKLKNAASDIMTTDAKISSDSGIDKMYGNSNDPAVKAAANTLKKMRNGMGLTSDKLDSIKKEAEKLKSNH